MCWVLKVYVKLISHEKTMEISQDKFKKQERWKFPPKRGVCLLQNYTIASVYRVTHSFLCAF